MMTEPLGVNRRRRAVDVSDKFKSPYELAEPNEQVPTSLRGTPFTVMVVPSQISPEPEPAGIPIGAADDSAEIQADRVADGVLAALRRQPEPPRPQPVGGGIVEVLRRRGAAPVGHAGGQLQTGD